MNTKQSTNSKLFYPNQELNGVLYVRKVGQLGDSRFSGLITVINEYMMCSVEVGHISVFIPKHNIAKLETTDLTNQSCDYGTVHTGTVVLKDIDMEIEGLYEDCVFSMNYSEDVVIILDNGPAVIIPGDNIASIMQ